MTLLRLAWRNLGRNRRRSMLMISIVALGTWAIVVMWGITEGFFKTMIDAQVQLEVGSLQIHNKNYLEDSVLENHLSEQQLQELIKNLQAFGIERVSPRITMEVLLKSSYGALGIQLRGFDPSREGQVTQLASLPFEGHYLQGTGEIILGKTLAELLDVRLGERIVVEAQGLSKPASRAFRVVGLFSTGLALLDRQTAFISLPDAQSLSGLAGGATELAIKLESGRSADRVAMQLRSSLGEAYSVSTLFDLNPLLRDIIRVNYVEMVPIMLILSLLAGFGVANTVMFTVLERIREFGVMMAVGLRPRQLGRLILLESLLTSSLGFIFGAVAGYLLIIYLSIYGIDFGSYVDAFPEFGMPHVVYAVTSGWYWIYGLSVVVLTTLVAAWYPARRATRLAPTEAIRYV